MQVLDQVFCKQRIKTQFESFSMANLFKFVVLLHPCWDGLSAKELLVQNLSYLQHKFE